MNQLPFPDTSTSLILRAKALEPKAWERLSRLYTPLVYKWICKAHLREDDATDVVQEVFQAVAKSIANFEMGEDQPPFRAWLWGITRHKVQDHFRRLRGQPKAIGGTDAHRLLAELPEHEPDDESDPNSLTNRDSLAYRALQLIETDFKENTWKAFWLTTIEGRKPVDVAEELGMSVGAVYTAKSRILTYLRNELRGLT